jgi:hypothetical protein
LLFGDMIAFSGDLQRFIERYSLQTPLPQLPQQLLTAIDELYLLGETGARLLQMVGLLNGVERQTIALRSHDPNGQTAEAWLVSTNNIRLLRLALYNCKEAAAQLGQMAQPTVLITTDSSAMFAAMRGASSLSGVHHPICICFRLRGRRISSASLIHSAVISRWLRRNS